MSELESYIRWIARSIFIELDDQQQKEIASKLIKSSKYNSMLLELEGMIREEGKLIEVK